MFGSGGDHRTWYQCIVPGCEAACKLWPRKDNFKEHVKRRHAEAGEEMLDLTVFLYVVRLADLYRNIQTDC